MILLLHPTHRKFIRLLRDKVSKGDVIFITQEDLGECGSLFLAHRKILKRGTKRHIGYYFGQ